MITLPSVELQGLEGIQTPILDSNVGVIFQNFSPAPEFTLVAKVAADSDGKPFLYVFLMPTNQWLKESEGRDLLHERNPTYTTNPIPLVV